MKAFVALVSTEEDFLTRTRDLLEADGYVVAAFMRPELAIQAFESVNFDVLISTVVLGAHNGFALAELAQVRIPRLQVLLASRNRRHAAANARGSARFLDYEFTLDAFRQSALPASQASHKASRTLDEIQRYLRDRINA